MPRQARQASESGIHHVMIRGVNRQAIFHDDQDRQRFLDFLSVTKQLAGCQILAYCLMTNHVHLVVRATAESVGQVMKRLGVRYAGWYNWKYGRVGHLFQDRFKSLPVESDEYLVALVRYVWNNPVDAGIVEHPRDYHWSSVGRAAGQRLVDEDALRGLVPPSVLGEVGEPTPEGWTPAPWANDRSLITDAEAMSMLRGWLKALGRASISELSRSDRDMLLMRLRVCGISIRRVSRLTGVGENTVRRASDRPVAA